MKKVFFVFFFIIALICLSSCKKKTNNTTTTKMNTTDFISDIESISTQDSIFDDGIENIMLASINSNDNDYLKFKNNHLYSVTSKGAITIKNIVVEAGEKEDIQKAIKRHVCLYFSNKNNIIVDGMSSTISLQDDISPIIIDNCDNITIKNLTIKKEDDKSILTFDILDINDNSIIVRIDNELVDIKDNDLYFGDYKLSDSKIYFYNSELKQIKELFDYKISNITKSSDNIYTINFIDELELFNSSDKLILKFDGNQTISSFIRNSKNITLENITFNNLFDYGLIFNNTENITLKNVNIINDNNTFISTNNMIELNSSSGDVNIVDSVFSGSLKDVIDIKSNYYELLSVSNNIIEIGYPNNYTSFDLFKENDEICILDKINFNPLSNYKILKIEHLLNNKLRLTLDNNVIEDIHSLIINNSRKPNYNISNNRIDIINGDCFSLGDSSITITNNTISNIASSIIKEKSDNYTNRMIDELVFKENIISNASYNYDYLIDINPTIKNDDSNYYYNKLITIINNDFSLNDSINISLSNIRKLTIYNNKKDFNIEKVKIKKMIENKSSYIMYAIGDSITYGAYSYNGNWFRIDNTYSKIVSDKLNTTEYYNIAESGTCYSSMANQEAYLKELSFSKRVGEIVDADLVLVAYGTNDFGCHTPLGYENDDKDISFYGALNYSFRILKENNPHADIYIITPLKRSDMVKNNLNLSLDDYRGAIVKIANKYGFYVINGEDFEIDPFNSNDKNNYMNDGVHVSASGHELLGEFVYDKLLNKHPVEDVRELNDTLYLALSEIKEDETTSVLYNADGGPYRINYIYVPDEYIRNRSNAIEFEITIKKESGYLFILECENSDISSCWGDSAKYKAGMVIGKDIYSNFNLYGTNATEYANGTVLKIYDKDTNEELTCTNINFEKGKTYRFIYRLEKGNALSFFYAKSVYDLNNGNAICWGRWNSDSYLYDLLDSLEFSNFKTHNMDGIKKMETKDEFKVSGYNATVLIPENFNGKWLYKTEFFYAFDALEKSLYNDGYARVYFEISDMYGSPRAINLMYEFYKELMKRYDMNPKGILLGFSRGGLYAFNFALAHPECVEKVYLDAPVLDLRSWPRTNPSYNEIDLHNQVMHEYGFNSEEEFNNYTNYPVSNLGKYFSLNIPTLLVAGAGDTTVEFSENSEVMINYATAHYISYFHYYVKVGNGETGGDHHPHSFGNIDGTSIYGYPMPKIFDVYSSVYQRTSKGKTIKIYSDVNEIKWFFNDDEEQLLEKYAYDDRLNFIYFGDSISQSAFATNDYGWTKMMAYSFNASVVDYSVSGYATFNYRDDFESKLVNGIVNNKRNICFIALGTNDSLLSENKDYNPLNNYIEDLNTYASICKRYNVEVVFIGLTRCDEARTTPINWSTIDQRYLNSRLDIYDNALKQVALDNNALYIELKDVITLDKNHDGIHPNDSGYKAMFKVISKSLSTYIKENPMVVNLIVDKSGCGDFTNINEAVDWIPNGSIVTITLKKGVYEEVVNINARFEEFTMIGESKYECIIINRTGIYKNSPFLVSGNFHLKNLTFMMTLENVNGWYPTYDTSNGILDTYPGYALHIDWSSYNPNELTYGLVENCYLYSEAFPAVGMGTNGNQTVEFLNCELVRNCLDERFKFVNHQGAILCHSSNGSNDPNQLLKITNCYLESNYGRSAHVRGDCGNGYDFTFESVNSIYYSKEEGYDSFEYWKDDSHLSPNSCGNSVTMLNQKEDTITHYIVYRSSTDDKVLYYEVVEEDSKLNKPSFDTIDVESIKSYKNSVTGDIIDFDNTYVSSSLIIIVELDEE